jgi:protocatechuate 3,4-dioxygenase beta subunit
MLSAIAVVYLTLIAQRGAPPPVPPQLGPPRDARSVPEATGTAVVRGRVVNADGRPVKRVLVSLSQTNTADTSFDQIPRGMVTRPVSRTAMTDAQGQFVFERLPAGFYRLSARPGPFQAQFLNGGYGQKRSESLPPPFEITEGQQFTAATILLPRSGVITGRITDDEGEPMSRVQVSVLYFAPGASGPTRSTGGDTDDLGRFRVFGLQAGDYLIMADIRSLNRYGGAADTDPNGFITTYFPGVPSELEAQRVQVHAGAETSGVDFRLIRGRLFTVTGTVLDSHGQPISPISVSVSQRDLTGDTRGFSGVGTNAQGQFTVKDLAPGDYTLVVRPRVSPRAVITMNGRQMPDVPEFAIVDLHVDSDISDFVITTRPTLSIAGRVVFLDGLPPTPPGGADPVRQIRVSAGPPPGGGIFAGPAANTQVSSDLTFTLNGLTSAAVVRVSGIPRNYVLKQVLVGSEDITDRPHEFVDRESGNLQIVLTSRISGLQGMVVDPGGKPAVDALVVLMSEPDSGQHATIYRSGAVDPYGRFRMQGLRSGRFVIIAIPRERLPRSTDPDAIDALAKEAQPLALNDGEFKALDLRVSGGGGNN